jgi:hypothetical protein
LLYVAIYACQPHVTDKRVTVWTAHVFPSKDGKSKSGTWIFAVANFERERVKSMVEWWLRSKETHRNGRY